MQPLRWWAESALLDRNRVKVSENLDREKLLKFEAEGQEFAKLFRSLKVSYSRKEILVSPILPKKQT